MPSALEDAIDRFRRDLLVNERQSASAMVRAYGQAWSAVGTIAQSGDEDLIAKATAEVEELRRRLYQLLAES